MREGVAAAVMSTEVVRLQIFDGTSSKISEFVTACRLYIRIKMRRAVVEEQIQYITNKLLTGCDT